MSADFSEVTVTSLRCEYLENPLGIDILSPRMSWVLQSDQRGQKQTAFRVLVSSSLKNLNHDTADLWDSAKTESDQSNHLEYAGEQLTSRMRVFWKVRVWDMAGRPGRWSEPAFWSMGLLRLRDWEARWVSFQFRGQETALPSLRKEFDISGNIQSATLYATAKGLYEIRINGLKVGKNLFAPEWTSYRNRIQYQTYDVTELLGAGRNAIGATLGEGWYAGWLQQWPPEKNVYGSDLELLVQLEIRTDDRELHLIMTDGSWKASLDGPILTSDMYAGETYDARNEWRGWDKPNFDDGNWKSVHMKRHLGKARLVSQLNEKICVTEEIAPIALSEPRSGTYVYDLGQNVVGWIRFSLRGKAGKTVQFKFNEMLNPDGTIYMDNLRAGCLAEETRRQTDEYICNGAENEYFEPHFTYHGFRYVEISGLGYEPTLADLVGRVFHSSASSSGLFACSDELLNRVWENATWSLRGNLMSVPTDCPQRDERMGWMGDAQIICQTANYAMDLAAFWNKWIKDIRDDQLGDGRYPSYAPYPLADDRSTGKSAWADAGIIVPWTAYVYYADKRLILEHFHSARGWVDHVHRENPDLISKQKSHGVDWLNIGGTIQNEFFSTAFFAKSAGVVADMASVLGKEHDARKYRRLCNDIRAAFAREYMADDGVLAGNSQGAYALALAFDLIPDHKRRQVATRMVESMNDNDGVLTTGIATTHLLLCELSRNGYHDEACRIVKSRQMPSWGFMVEQGATTIWERWNGYVPGVGFADNNMNSFNHFAFGAVGEWMMRELAGIHLDPSHPACKHFAIRPRIGSSFAWVEAYYDSLHGRILSSWKVAGNRASLNITVPVNTTADVLIPTKDVDTIEESGKKASMSEGVSTVKAGENNSLICVESGSYEFAFHV